jgi:hypothetical protein
MARDWWSVDYRKVSLRDIATNLVAFNSDAASFMPIGPSDLLKFIKRLPKSYLSDVR